MLSNFLAECYQIFPAGCCQSCVARYYQNCFVQCCCRIYFSECYQTCRTKCCVAQCCQICFAKWYQRCRTGCYQSLEFIFHFSLRFVSHFVSREDARARGACARVPRSCAALVVRTPVCREVKAAVPSIVFELSLSSVAVSSAFACAADPCLHCIDSLHCVDSLHCIDSLHCVCVANSGLPTSSHKTERANIRT